MPKFINNITMSAGAKVTGLPTPSAFSDAATKEYVDSKTNVIYTSAVDDFDDSTKIASSTNLTVDGGLIRPFINTFVDTLSDKRYIDDINTASQITVNTTAGTASVTSGAVGYDVANTGNVTNKRILQTEAFVFPQAITKARLKASFTTPASLTGYTSPRTTNIQNIMGSGITNNILASNGLQYATKDGDTVWEFAKRNNSSNTYVLTDGTNTINIDSVNYNPTISNTLRHNVSIYATATEVYVSYPIAADAYRIKKVNKSTREVNDVHTLTVTGATLQKMDIAFVNNRLHVIYSNATARTINYYYIQNGTAVTPVALITQGTALLPFDVRLVECNNVNKLGWAGFSQNSSLGAFFGIIDTTPTATSPYQFRITPASTTNNATGCYTFANSPSNGVGDMVYDSATDMFYIMTSSSSSNAMRFYKIGTAPNSAEVGFSAINTTPFNSVGQRNMTMFIENASNVHLLFSNTARTELRYVKINLSASSGFPPLTGSRLIHTGTEIYPTAFIRTSMSPFYFDSYYLATSENNSVISYKAGILPELYGKVGNAAVQKLDNNNSKEFIFASNANQIVQFEFVYPIMSADFTGSERSVVLSEYTLEQTEPAVTNPVQGNFTSDSLITDRIVKNVTLDVSEIIPSGFGNSIQWQVASLGTNWINVGSGTTTTAVGTSNNWQVTFNEGYYGSNLRVQATMTKGANANTLALVPTIDRYQVTVPNTVMYSDIQPLQINMMKMGLKLNALGTYSTTSFVKMMIDLFENNSNIDTTNSTSVLDAGAYGAGELWSKVEDTSADNVNTVTSAIVMAEFQGTAPTFFIRRGTASWTEITLESVFTFTTGTPTNNIQISATIPSGTQLLGWAYLYA